MVWTLLATNRTALVLSNPVREQPDRDRRYPDFSEVRLQQYNHNSQRNQCGSDESDHGLSQQNRYELFPVGDEKFRSYPVVILLMLQILYIRDCFKPCLWQVA